MSKQIATEMNLSVITIEAHSSQLTNKMRAIRCRSNLESRGAGHPPGCRS
ncbi:LuxR C-terminal-related transcriptional regulator [Caballeronia sp. dw_276]